MIPLRISTPRSKTGLFSAAVAALVAVSVQDLKQSSQDISAFYLASIYQILADSNGSQVLIPPTLPNPTTPFSPPTSAVWVNSLWFLSLVISLTCALLATFLQQWARRYMRVTQTRYSPHKRARIRAFFAEGVEKLHLPWAVEALPALLHLSLFLFFAGLAVFLFNINHTVFNVAISWVGFCTGMYVCITLIPIFRHDSPYYAPLSSSAWYLYTGIRFTVFRILWWAANRCNMRASIRERAFVLWSTYRDQALRGIRKEFEETAHGAPSEIDGRALMWTYESLDEDHELEQFFSGIPGFCSSKVVDNAQSSLDNLRGETMALGLSGFLERTWSSNLLSETIKIRRLVICVRAIDAAHLSDAARETFNRIFRTQTALLESVELGHTLISRSNNDDQEADLLAEGMIACVIARAPQRNDRWFSLTMHHLGISEHVLRDYLDHGDSVLLANLIHFTRLFVHNFLNANWETFPVYRIIWLLRYKCNLQNTLPELQYQFCYLWYKIVRQGRVTYHPLFLDHIHSIHNAFHQGSTSYYQDRICRIPNQRISSASNLNEVDSGRLAETARAPITTSHPLRHHDPVPFSIPPVTEYGASPSPTSNLDHVIQHLVDGQSHDASGALDNLSPVASSVYPAPLENARIFGDTAADPIQETTDPSAISSMVNTGSHSTSGRNTASRHTRNMTTPTPPFVLDTAPPPIPLLVVSPDRPAPQIFDNPPVNQSGRSPDDGPISLSSSQNFTPYPLAPQVIPSFDSNITTEIGPLSAPDDTLDSNLHVMSQSFTQSSPDITQYSLRPEDGDP